MIRIGKKIHTDPYLIDLENLERLCDFVTKYADVCAIKIVSYTQKEKEVREFTSFSELLSLKEVIKYKICKMTLRGYKDKKEIITLDFTNPTRKIFPFIEPATLKSTFIIEGEEDFEKFLAEYEEKIESVVSYKRVAYKMLYSFQPSFVASLFTAVYVLSLSRQGAEASLLVLASVLFFLTLSTLANFFFYPFLYIYNPLIKFDLELVTQNSYKIYLNLLARSLRDNSKLLFLSILVGLGLVFYLI